MKIEADPRHTAMKILSRSPITSRQYSEWSMGCEQATEETFSQTLGLRNLRLGNFKLEWLESNREVGALVRWARQAWVL